MDDAGRVEMELKGVREFLCGDAWGNRLNVDLKTNLVARGASAALLNTDFGSIVWLSGSDATNEFGDSDDVIRPSPPTNK
jgi:hypothetical protein